MSELDQRARQTCRGHHEERPQRHSPEARQHLGEQLPAQLPTGPAQGRQARPRDVGDPPDPHGRGSEMHPVGDHSRNPRLIHAARMAPERHGQQRQRGQRRRSARPTRSRRGSHQRDRDKTEAGEPRESAEQEIARIVRLETARSVQRLRGHDHDGEPGGQPAGQHGAPPGERGDRVRVPLEIAGDRSGRRTRHPLRRDGGRAGRLPFDDERVGSRRSPPGIAIARAGIRLAGGPRRAARMPTIVRAPEGQPAAAARGTAEQHRDEQARGEEQQHRVERSAQHRPQRPGTGQRALFHARGRALRIGTHAKAHRPLPDVPVDRRNRAPVDAIGALGRRAPGRRDQPPTGHDPHRDGHPLASPHVHEPQTREAPVERLGVGEHDARGSAGQPCARTRRRLKERRMSERLRRPRRRDRADQPHRHRQPEADPHLQRLRSARLPRGAGSQSAPSTIASQRPRPRAPPTLVSS